MSLRVELDRKNLLARCNIVTDREVRLLWEAVQFSPLHVAPKIASTSAGNRTMPACHCSTACTAGRFEVRWWCAELHRLRGVFLAALGADETQIEAAFCEAISTAKEQKSISLQKRAEATCAEYHRQKASGSGEHGFRLPLL